MIEINMRKDFNIIKLAQERHIKQAISLIDDKPGNDNDIVLDLSGCIIDYPATPKFVDYFLFQLEKKEGSKSLSIKVDGLGNKEIYLLYTLILEGEFFSTNKKFEELEIDKYHKEVNNKLKEKGIILNIIYTPDNNKCYEYGK